MVDGDGGGQVNDGILEFLNGVVVLFLPDAVGVVVERSARGGQRLSSSWPSCAW